MKQILKTAKAPNLNPASSQGTKCGNRVFVSGMAGVDPITLLPVVGMEAQTRLALTHLLTVAEQGGMRPEDFIKCNVYLRDMDQLAVFDHIYTAFFAGHLPAREVFEMPSLVGPYEVVIEGYGHSADAWKTLKKEPIRTDKAARYSAAQEQGIKVGNFLYTSSQPPLIPGKEWPATGFENQIRTAIENMIAVVEAGGGTKESLVKVIVFMKDLDRFDDFNVIYKEYFTAETNPPARACYGVSSFTGPFQVEVEGIAYLGGDRVTIKTDRAPVYNLPFCQGIRAEDMVFISGQVGFDPVAKRMPEDFEGQFHALMGNLLEIAKAGGAAPEDIVRTTGYLIDARSIGCYDQLYRGYFPGTPPAAMNFEVTGLSYDYAVEVDSHACITK